MTQVVLKSITIKIHHNNHTHNEHCMWWKTEGRLMTDVFNLESGIRMEIDVDFKKKCQPMFSAQQSI